MIRRPPRSTLFSLHDALPISDAAGVGVGRAARIVRRAHVRGAGGDVSALGRRLRVRDRKSTRLNSSHLVISYAVFCLKKKKNEADSEDTVLVATHMMGRS